MGVKWKNMFAIILINIFLLCLVSLFDEYDSMREKIQRLDYIFDLSVDTALTSVMGSEELFSEKFASDMSSFGFAKKSGSKRLLQSETKVFRNKKWITGNTYLMAMYYNSKGRFPTTQAEFNTWKGSKGTTEIFEYMFGDAGTDYEDGELYWANKRQDMDTLINDYGTDRAPTSRFKTFYDRVGYRITQNYMLKSDDGSGSYNIIEKSIPTLSLMGLELNNYNKVTSKETADNLTSSVHRGKNGSEYFLTPYSLGVTYIPVEILKPTILSHLEQMIRFSKCKTSPKNKGESMTDVVTTYASADGCIPEGHTGGFGWYQDNGAGVVTEVQHRYSSNTKTYITGKTDMLNDGMIEYDMSTLKVKVDYFVADFYNKNNWKIVNNIIGARPGITAYNELPEKLKATDTAKNTVSNNRIVAKVTVKMKIHIPYESGILTWFVDRTSTKANNEHYDVKVWNDNTHSILKNQDGLWYQYSTFVAITR